MPITFIFNDTFKWIFIHPKFSHIDDYQQAANKCGKRVRSIVTRDCRHRHVIITASSVFKETSVRPPMSCARAEHDGEDGHASYLTVIRARRVVGAAVEFGYRYRALIARPHNLGRLYDRNSRRYVDGLSVDVCTFKPIRPVHTYILVRGMKLCSRGYNIAHCFRQNYYIEIKHKYINILYQCCSFFL